MPRVDIAMSPTAFHFIQAYFIEPGADSDDPNRWLGSRIVQAGTIGETLMQTNPQDWVDIVLGPPGIFESYAKRALELRL